MSYSSEESYQTFRTWEEGMCGEVTKSWAGPGHVGGGKEANIDPLDRPCGWGNEARAIQPHFRPHG